MCLWPESMAYFELIPSVRQRTVARSEFQAEPIMLKQNWIANAPQPKAFLFIHVTTEKTWVFTSKLHKFVILAALNSGPAFIVNP